MIPNVTRECLRKNYTKVFSNGLIQLPKRVKEQLQIKSGDLLEFKIEDNKIIFIKIEDDGELN